MLHRYLILHGLQRLIPAKFREKYSELAVGRRRRRQDETAEEARQQVSAVGLVSSLWSSRRQDVADEDERQQVSAVGLESSLWSSETWTGKQLKTQKKYRNLTFAEDLESFFQDEN